ncbi:L,D-transpeptidase [Pontixanthobacter aestiaquae]|uniref:L,D-transpeptidase family protein n=1 Tax=Pontixanthobacter aestiaquae TaxID=1509367 RepID=A0A844Z6Z6_9SPHN|nr:L,D-transpeptidase [Pontixanthobacter aestiaquae]MDN3645981.1 L,D-transpeptidase [Pontixanthobacter aestiaquae]MXO83026.1 L,D-transpeptidase family protein [Pontixanthobacter aestiaquae]
MAKGQTQRDWTDGCIAVFHEDIKELWDAVPNGMPIEKRP